MVGSSLRSALVAGRYRVDPRLLGGPGPAVAVDALAEESRVVRLLRLPSSALPALTEMVAAWDAAAAAGLPVIPVGGVVEDAALGPVLVLGPPAPRPLGPRPAGALAAEARVLGAALVAAGVPVGRLRAADLGLDDAGSLVFHTPPW
ncbi:MAG: hypothetical protein AVDCRST_MAG79-2555, partial [uncultured Thermoleophilia bacterium]